MEMRIIKRLQKQTDYCCKDLEMETPLVVDDNGFCFREQDGWSTLIYAFSIKTEICFTNSSWEKY